MVRTHTTRLLGTMNYNKNWGEQECVCVCGNELLLQREIMNRFWVAPLSDKPIYVLSRGTLHSGTPVTSYHPTNEMISLFGL